MNGFASSIFNRIQDIVGTNSSNLNRLQTLSGVRNLKAPLLVTNPQVFVFFFVKILFKMFRTEN